MKISDYNIKYRKFLKEFRNSYMVDWQDSKGFYDRALKGYQITFDWELDFKDSEVLVTNLCLLDLDKQEYITLNEKKTRDLEKVINNLFDLEVEEYENPMAHSFNIGD